MEYTELQVTSNFSFLRGASHPEELMEYAASLGYREMAITDRNTLAGIVRAHVAAKKAGIRLIVGCRLELLDGPSLLAYPTNKTAYSGLCQLLSKGNLRAEKGDCHLYKGDVFAHANGMLFIVIPPGQLNERFDLDNSFTTNLQEYKTALKEQLYIAASRHYYAHDAKYLFRLAQLS
ncbi:MAG TPA: PHP domain-containing protein, partial [Niastella sp.]